MKKIYQFASKIKINMRLCRNTIALHIKLTNIPITLLHTIMTIKV